jgi:UDP-N-acetyl-D-glucosamine dehydrogenase
MTSALFTKIETKQATIGILGLGHTGLFLANEFRQVGFPLIGYDIDAARIEKLKRKENYLPFFDPQSLFNSIDTQQFIPTHDPSVLSRADILIISVPTPLNKQRMPDLTILEGAAAIVVSVVRNGQLIVMQSTSYPGTSEEIFIKAIEKKGMKVGYDFFFAHVPEREDAGNPQVVLSKVPRIAGGMTPECLNLAKRLYEEITIRVVPCSSIRIAEATKVFENSFRLINIAFVDELKVVFDRMNLDIWEIIEAASTKPFGFTPFYPGPGIGGECIPVDPIYLSWKAKEFQANTLLIDLAIDVNTKAYKYVIQKVFLSLNERLKCLKGSKIIVLGVAFKKNVTDTRESPALKIIPILKEVGATVIYHDALVPEIPFLQLKSTDLSETLLKEVDCVLIITDHDYYNWEWICENSQLIIDTRNATRSLKQYQHKIIR